MVLEPTDLLVQVAIHTSMHAYVLSPGLRLHVDVDRVVRDNEIEWYRFVDQVNGMKTATRVFFSLTLAKAILGTPVPDDVLDALAPAEWRRRAMDRLLARAGLTREGKASLPKTWRMAVDRVLDERSTFGWVRNALFPDREWMTDHFSKRIGGSDGLLRLHFARWSAFLFNGR
jgi:hypothetical protein